mmetsp:Transcript_43858/g.129850  ORF Transcript_43858/g.129850 Transcript_43858/m.129850 type:complete len:82 (+) Transcript_43858:55-300(+)
MGKNYGSFDSAGKLMFLDQMDSVAERWEVFLKRFKLMGEEGPRYVSDSEDMLKRLGLRSDLARKILRDAHDMLRADAERLA